MQRLLIHIGPPKTATTSLQIALAEIVSDEISYLGAYQPRELNGRTRCHVLNDVSRKPELINTTQFQEFESKVLDSQSMGRTPVVVEEVILDGSQRVSWKEKLANLAKATKGLNPILAITLRDPLQGVPSLHREFFPHLSVVEKISLFAFTLSTQCQVYNYRQLLKEIKKSGFAEIFIIRFSEMTRNGLDLSGLSQEQPSKLSLINIPHENSAPRKKINSRWLRLYIKRWHNDFLLLDSLAARSSRPEILKLDDALMVLDEVH